MKGNVAVLQDGGFRMFPFQRSASEKLIYKFLCSLLNVIGIFPVVLVLYFAAIICALLILHLAFDSTEQIPLQIILPSAIEY